MAYVHGQRDQKLTTSGGVPIISTTGGLTVRWAPGYQPVVVRALAVQNLTTLVGVIPPVIHFFENAVAGSTATGNFTAIDTITMTTAASQHGQVFFVEDLATRVEPGHEILAQVLTVSTEAVLIQATAYVENTSEAPAALTQMTESV